MPGRYAVAEALYTGGKQGASEYWWLNIRQGERKQLGDAEAVGMGTSTAELLQLIRRAEGLLDGNDNDGEKIAGAGPNDLNENENENENENDVTRAKEGGDGGSGDETSVNNNKQKLRDDARKVLEKDPRVILIRDADIGSIYKVKCRPVRSDGHRGEIFTSKPSAEVLRSEPF